MTSNVRKILIMGAGGNATVIASAIEDLIETCGGYEIIGFLDDMKEKGVMINGYPVLGVVSDAPSYLKDKDVFFVYSLLTAKKLEERIEKLSKLDLPIERFATLIHPKAAVSRHASLGHGVVVMPGVCISPNVTVGNFVSIYGNSLIGHDSVIEDYCFVANCVSVGSTVRLLRGSYLGSNSSVREKVTVGRGALVGIGSVVIKDVPDVATVVGNPAKVMINSA